MRIPAACILLALALAPGLAAAASGAEDETHNTQKSVEREVYDYGATAYQQELAALGAREQLATTAALTRDSERRPANLCGVIRQNACLGDARLWDWETKGHGIVRPVLFTARSGATLSGHVWATRDGPPRRPAVVFVTGSIQVPEPAYWFVATTLAKRGFVVLTFDVQGQGLSDVDGASVDTFEGMPSQSGEPFYDGAEDALDFLLSTPDHFYVPRISCTTGVSHADKQDRRVADGLDAPYNPLWGLVDPDRVGIGGQSLGAAAASYVGQRDPRVRAIFALDNLSVPAAPANLQSPITCPSDPASRGDVAITKPAIGISNDYFLTPEPYSASSPPDPQEKAAASLAYSKAGVDSMQVNIRGGTHEECAYIPLAKVGRATLRGIDFCSWYLAAWMEKYVKGDPTADRRLFTRRWLADGRDREIDPDGGGNLFSFHFRSRIDVRLSANAKRVVCENLRAGGCAYTTADDGVPGSFDRRALALTKDGDGGPRATVPRTRNGRAPITTPTRLRAASRHGHVVLRALAGGPTAGETVGFQVQVRAGHGWRTVRRELVPARWRAVRGARRGSLVRARAVDRLGGLGGWSRPLRVRRG